MRTAFACFFCLVATVEAFDLILSPDAVREALALGQTGIASERVAFRRPYRLRINQPPLDYVDVVTPFRRIVDAAEARLQSGERLFGQREALSILEGSAERVELRLELTFHPLNTFVGVPDYSVDLMSVRDGRPVEPRRTDRIPRFGPRVDGQPAVSPTAAVGLLSGPSQPLLGGTIVAEYDGRGLESRGVYEVSVRDGGKTLARARVDLGTLR